MLTTLDFPGVEEMHQSYLKRILDNAEKWAWSQMHPEPQSDSMKVGSALHCLAFFGEDKFKELYAVAPVDLDRRTKAGKETWAELTKKYDSDHLLTDEQNTQCLEMFKSLKSHVGSSLLRGRFEVDVKWEMSGTKFAGRLDCLDGSVIVDLKTTICARRSAFKRSVFDYGYDIQAESYSRSIGGCTKFFWVCVENSAPYSVAVYQADDNIFTLGRRRIEEALSVYKYCLDKGYWFGYPNEVQVLEADEWMFKA